MIIYNILNFTSIVSSKIIDYCSNVCKDIIIEYVNIINKNTSKTLLSIDCIDNNSNEVSNCLCKCINENALQTQTEDIIVTDRYYGSINLLFLFYLLLLMGCLCCCCKKKGKSKMYVINSLPAYNEIDYITNNLENNELNENNYLNNVKPPNYDNIDID